MKKTYREFYGLKELDDMEEKPNEVEKFENEGGALQEVENRADESGLEVEEKSEDIAKTEDEEVPTSSLMAELNEHVLNGTLDRITAARLGARASKAGDTEVARRVNAFIKKM